MNSSISSSVHRSNTGELPTSVPEKRVHDIWYQSHFDPRERLEAAGKIKCPDHEKTLVVTVHQLRFPVTEDILDSIFSAFGKVEEIEFLPVKEDLKVLLRFQFAFSANCAKCLHGRFMYDSANLLDVHGLSRSDLDGLKKNVVCETNRSELMATSKVIDREIKLWHKFIPAVAAIAEDSFSRTENEKEVVHGLEELPVEEKTMFDSFQEQNPQTMNVEIPHIPILDTVCNIESHLEGELEDSSIKEGTEKFGLQVFDEFPQRTLNELEAKSVESQVFDKITVKEVGVGNPLGNQIKNGFNNLKVEDGLTVQGEVQVLDDIHVKSQLKLKEVAFKLLDKLTVKEMNRGISFVNLIADESEENENLNNEGKISLNYTHDKSIAKYFFDPGGYSLSKLELHLFTHLDFEVVFAGLSDMDLKNLRDVKKTSLSCTHVQIDAENLDLTDEQKSLIDYMIYILNGLCLTTWKLRIHFVMPGKLPSRDLDAIIFLGHKYFERLLGEKVATTLTEILQQLVVRMTHLAEFKRFLVGCNFVMSYKVWWSQSVDFLCSMSSFLFGNFRGDPYTEATSKPEKKVSYQELKEVRRERAESLFISFVNLIMNIDMSFFIFCHDKLKNIFRFDLFLVKYVDGFQNSGNLDESLKTLTKGVVFGLKKLSRDVLWEVVICLMKELSTWVTKKAITLVNAHQTDVAHLFGECLTILSAVEVATGVAAVCYGVKQNLSVLAPSNWTSHFVNVNHSEYLWPNEKDLPNILAQIAITLLMSLVFYIAALMHCHNFSFQPTTYLDDFKEQLLLKKYMEASKEKQEDRIFCEENSTLLHIIVTHLLACTCRRSIHSGYGASFIGKQNQKNIQSLRTRIISTGGKCHDLDLIKSGNIHAKWTNQIEASGPIRW